MARGDFAEAAQATSPSPSVPKVDAFSLFSPIPASRGCPEAGVPEVCLPRTHSGARLRADLYHWDLEEYCICGLGTPGEGAKEAEAGALTAAVDLLAHVNGILEGAGVRARCAHYTLNRVHVRRNLLTLFTVGI